MTKEKYTQLLFSFHLIKTMRKDSIHKLASIITKVIFIGIISLTLNSCATMLNSKKTSSKIIANEPILFSIVNGDSIKSYGSEMQITVARSKHPMEIKVYYNNSADTISVQSQNSLAYWLNIYPNWHLWTGFLIDRNKAKRYTYPKRIYIDNSDTSDGYATYYPRSRKGKLYLHISFPHINSFLLKPDNEKNIKINTGFWGSTIGLDYYHNPKQFINLSASAVLDFFLPVPGAVDIHGEYELMTSAYLAISNNHRIQGFLLGYGVSFSKNTWSYRDYGNSHTPSPIRDPLNKSNYAFGFVFPIYYEVVEHFYIGSIYRPTIFRLSSTNSIDYEHLISIDFKWTIKLKE